MRGAQEVSIFGTHFEVKAEVEIIRSMSAHGDYEDLRQWLGSQDPHEVNKLFLVHGEYEVQTVFREWLLKKVSATSKYRNATTKLASATGINNKGADQSDQPFFIFLLKATQPIAKG